MNSPLHKLFADATAARLDPRRAVQQQRQREVSVLAAFKDQLLMALLVRLVKDGELTVPFGELQDTSNWQIHFERNEIASEFKFKLQKKSLLS